MALERFHQPLSLDIWASGLKRALAFKDILFHLRRDILEFLHLSADRWPPCPQLVMAAEFSLGPLPYIKILLSSPTSLGPGEQGWDMCKPPARLRLECCCYFSSSFWTRRQVGGERRLSSFMQNLIRAALPEKKERGRDGGIDLCEGRVRWTWSSWGHCPGQPVVRTPRIPCRECRFDPWLGAQTTHALWPENQDAIAETIL